MHDNNVHEALYLNFKINDPWVGDAGSWVGP